MFSYVLREILKKNLPTLGQGRTSRLPMLLGNSLASPPQCLILVFSALVRLSLELLALFAINPCS